MNEMNEINARRENDEQQSMKTWLTEEVRLVMPRYWPLLAAFAAVVLLFVALD